MPLIKVKTHAEGAVLPREEQLAWKIASMAAANRRAEPEVVEMIGNRILDNAAVALAAINREPVRHARLLALGYPHPREGARLFGLPSDRSFHCEWAALANGVAVRELDMHDTYLAADYSHPADNIPGILAVAQQAGCGGGDLMLGLLTGYETQMALVSGICLHEHKIDHVAHLAPGVAAGIGSMLALPVEQIFQAINQSVHLACATRQSRKGDITSWKAYAPAQANKIAIEAVARARLGERSPSPIYEGGDAVIAWMLGGPEREYSVPLPAPGEPLRAILRSYTKEHSAEYQAQALIDLGFALHQRRLELEKVREVVIRTSHHTHYVIGTGSKDPQKMDPDASRETLDHSAMYILAVAWEDGAWHHVHSYTPERAHRPSTVRLWRQIRTEEVAEWTAAYHATNPDEKKFGAEVVVVMADGTRISERLDNPNAHYLGKKPFSRPDYVRKLRVLSEGLAAEGEIARFVGLVERLPELSPAQVRQLNPVVMAGQVEDAQSDRVGLF
ncbi:MAG: MmgE/PrpD family protein [Candidatus Handelsmanbacteria bacterium]|nr:MmgE/PrpD family protein [Candidatus Handelsmanbacteria bacterium]